MNKKHEYRLTFSVNINAENQDEAFKIFTGALMTEDGANEAKIVSVRRVRVTDEPREF